MFTQKFVFSTSVIDNGISINDDTLKTIIINSVSPTQIVQMLGRKRVQPDEKVDVYIKVYSGREINGFLKQIHDGLRAIQEAEALGAEEFLRQNKRFDFNKIAVHNTGEVNQARKADLLYKQSIYGDENFMNNYPAYIAELLQQSTFEIIEKRKTQNEITCFLEKYSNREIRGDEIKELKKSFFETVFKASGKTYKNLGQKTLNSVLFELKANCHFTSTRRGGQTLWTLVDGYAE